MIFKEVTITATPEQVERQWDKLTPFQKSQVEIAKSFGKMLNVVVFDTENDKILYDLVVLQ